MHGILWILGVTNGSGRWYLWWSGFFADITIFAAAILFVRHKNCHSPGCWRLGHIVPTTGLLACRRHHPHDDEHQEALKAEP